MRVRSSVAGGPSFSLCNVRTRLRSSSFRILLNLTVAEARGILYQCNVWLLLQYRLESGFLPTCFYNLSPALVNESELLCGLP